MADTVRIKFCGYARVPVGGDMVVPRQLWEAKQDDEGWSLALESYIQQNIDGLNHFDLGGLDDDEIEIDDVALAGSPTSGRET